MAEIERCQRSVNRWLRGALRLFRLDSGEKEELLRFPMRNVSSVLCHSVVSLSLGVHYALRFCSELVSQGTRILLRRTAFLFYSSDTRINVN